MTRNAVPDNRSFRKGTLPAPSPVDLSPPIGLDVSVVIGEPSNPSHFHDAVRRERLRAAAIFLVVTLVALFLRTLVAGGGELLLLQAAVIGGLGTSVVVLWSGLPLSTKGLRALEFIVFGLTAAYLSVRQYQLMHAWIDNGDEASIILEVKTTTIGTILLAFSYGMLIPNTWRAAAKVVGAIVALPLVIEFSLLLTHPLAFQIAWQFASWKRLSEDAVYMMIAAGLTVYGTHVINTLRSEAFEARQLNQYRLGRRLGSGGMGEVYLAEHSLLKRPCALKLIRRESADNPISLTRFEREVRATARLSHPNTVEIYDYGRTDSGTFFYVMEYLPGLSLDDLIRRYGPMPPGRVIYLLTQVCGAIAEAHAAGLIHRDLKPGNIFSCHRGGRFDVAKLLDFGMVKAPETEPWKPDETVAGMVRGTPLYMAPEQITNGETADHRCDLYSLGAVAYALLTGRPPFTGEDSHHVMTAQVCDPVAPIRLTHPDIPEDLEWVVLRCLAKRPDSRFPNAHALADALLACASASEWDEGKAAQWWTDHEPDATSPLPS